ncbi:hypothetical protein [Bifidobacterium leontopitheci]|nr:hypothetical protein [Bifidobacterium leontopitheci]
MRAHHIITDKLMQASRYGRCLSASDAAEGKALRRRVQAGLWTYC